MIEPTRHFRLSDRARARLRDLSSGRPMRVFAERTPGGGLEVGFSFDARREGDAPVEDTDLSLVTDPASLSVLAGSLLDFEESADKRGFVLARDATCADRFFAE